MNAVVIDVWMAVSAAVLVLGAVGVAGFFAYRAGERRDREIDRLRERVHTLANVAAKMEGRLDTLEDRSGPHEIPVAGVQTGWRTTTEGTRSRT